MGSTSRALRAATAGVALLALLGLAAAAPAQAGEGPPVAQVFSKVKPYVEGVAVLPLHHGSVNVMIYGGDGFDPSTIDVSSLRAGHDGDEAKPLVARLLRDRERQGYSLLVRFSVDEMELECGDMNLRITGRTGEGQEGGMFFSTPEIATRLCKTPIS